MVNIMENILLHQLPSPLEVCWNHKISHFYTNKNIAYRDIQNQYNSDIFDFAALMYAERELFRMIYSGILNRIINKPIARLFVSTQRVINFVYTKCINTKTYKKKDAVYAVLCKLAHILSEKYVVSLEYKTIRIQSRKPQAYHWRGIIIPYEIRLMMLKMMHSCDDVADKILSYLYIPFNNRILYTNYRNIACNIQDCSLPHRCEQFAPYACTLICVNCRHHILYHGNIIYDV
jgi:hypothetical protein